MKQQLNSRQKRMIRRMFWNDVKEPLFIITVVAGLVIMGILVGTLQVKGV